MTASDGDGDMIEVPRQDLERVLGFGGPPELWADSHDRLRGLLITETCDWVAVPYGRRVRVGCVLPADHSEHHQINPALWTRP